MLPSGTDGPELQSSGPGVVAASTAGALETQTTPTANTIAASRRLMHPGTGTPRFARSLGRTRRRRPLCRGHCLMWRARVNSTCRLAGVRGGSSSIVRGLPYDGCERLTEEEPGLGATPHDPLPPNRQRSQRGCKRRRARTPDQPRAPPACPASVVAPASSSRCRSAKLCADRKGPAPASPVVALDRAAAHLAARNSLLLEEAVRVTTAPPRADDGPPVASRLP